MREDAEQDLVPLRSRVSRGQRGAEPALQPREDTLGLPPLPIEGAWKVSLHGAPVGRQRPAPPHVAAVECDDGLADAEPFATEPVVVLGVIARIAQQPVRDEPGGRLADRGRELRRVLARPTRDHGAGDQVAGRIADRRELRPAAAPAAEEGPPPVDEVGAHVAGLEPGRIDGGDGSRRDQAERVRAAEAGRLEVSEGPPFSSRRAA